jgi:hypothetical protein
MCARLQARAGITAFRERKVLQTASKPSCTLPHDEGRTMGARQVIVFNDMLTETEIEPTIATHEVWASKLLLAC